MEEILGKTAKIIRHNGVEVIISDFTGLKGNELTEALKANTKAVAPRTNIKRDWPTINIFRDCLFNEDSVKYLSKIQKAMYGHFIASANIGLSDIQKMALDIPRGLFRESFSVRHFDTEKEALDWVTQEYKKHSQVRK